MAKMQNIGMDDPAAFNLMGQGTTSSPHQKETIVRVKRKRHDDPFESLWLEVTVRAIKRHEPDLAGLSLDAATTRTPGENASTKLLFRRVETLSPSGVKELSLSEFRQKVKNLKRSHDKDERKQIKSTKDKQGQLLATAKEQHEASSRTARFEQVWQSRRKEGRLPEDNDPMQELFQLYDVVRVDVETESAAKTKKREQAKREAELREGQLLCNYMPLLREVLPSVAAEIDALPPVASDTEAGGESSSNSQDYVYDVYTLDEEMADSKMSDVPYPIIQIMDDEHRDWQEVSDPDYDSEDSNDENNLKNDYPEEEDEFVANGDSSSDVSNDINPYSLDNEEYDTVLSDEERDMWRPRR